MIIKDRYFQNILFQDDCTDIKETLQNAVRCNANLVNADLAGANLAKADLSGADLTEANLSEADLFNADLVEANLSEARLFRAHLLRANLFRANLSGAYLPEANLSGAYLSGAVLLSIQPNWRSHDLIAAILLQAAGDNPRRRMVAGLVRDSRDWCWSKLIAIPGFKPEKKWALETLQGYATPDNPLPYQGSAWLTNNL